MTDTLTIRPTPAADVHIGDRFRWEGHTYQVDQITDPWEWIIRCDDPDHQGREVFCLPDTGDPDTTIDIIVNPATDIHTPQEDA